MDLNSNSWNIHLKNISKLGVKARQRKIKKDLLDGEKILKNKLKSKEFTLILARLCGYIMGDGSIIHGKERNRNAIHYDIRFYPDDLDMAKIYIDSFEKIYSYGFTIFISSSYLLCDKSLSLEQILIICLFNSL